MAPESPDASRLDKLEEREGHVEAKLKKLEAEEKKLKRKLNNLAQKELELVTLVGELVQVKKRRPDFLMNYGAAKKQGGDFKAEPPAQPVRNEEDAKKAVSGIMDSTQEKKDEAIMAVEPRPDSRETKAEKVFDEVLKKPKEESPDRMMVVATERRAGKAEKVLSQVLTSPKAPDISDQLPKEKKVADERKQILKAQIKNVLNKKEPVVDEQSIIDSKEPIKKLSLGDRSPEATRLFKLLLERGAMSADEAMKVLEVDKKTIDEWIHGLEDSGIIEVNKSLYGGSKLKVKVLSENVKAAMVK